MGWLPTQALELGCLCWGPSPSPITSLSLASNEANLQHAAQKSEVNDACPIGVCSGPLFGSAGANGPAPHRLTRDEGWHVLGPPGRDGQPVPSGACSGPALLMGGTGPPGQRPHPGLSHRLNWTHFRSREPEGAKAGGRGEGACLFLGIHSMSACHKYLDREDLWVRFAILFSLRVINQLRAHPGCGGGLRTHVRALTRTGGNAVCIPPAFSGVGEGALQGAELWEGKNPGL